MRKKGAVSVDRNLSDKWILFLFNKIGIRIGKKRIEDHYAHNIKVWKEHLERKDMGRGKYIEKQSVLKDMKYGFGTMDKNGCGIIAVYNALQVMGCETGGKKVEITGLPELIACFESRGGAALGGIFGTVPKSIEIYFREKGYEVKDWLNDGYLFSPEHKTGNVSHAGILLCYNRKNTLLSGLHYVCFAGDTRGDRSSEGKESIWMIGIR